MAYFNHAFTKMFMGTQLSADNPNANLTDGFIDTAGIHISSLSVTGKTNADLNYGPGTFGFFDPKTWESVDATYFSSHTCCPLVLASASLMSKDKVGSYHGGYQESNKSKMINPKFVQRVYKVESCVPQQAVIAIGNTPVTGTTGIAGLTNITAGLVDPETYAEDIYYNVPLTGGSGVGATATITVDNTGAITGATISAPGAGYVDGETLTIDMGAVTNIVGGTAPTTVDIDGLTTVPTEGYQGGTTSDNCCFEFLCGETYYLRVDVKGSPALRALNHQAYYTVDAYTGCCDSPVPAAVNSTIVMIKWAENIVRTQYLNSFIMPVIYDEDGVAWYAPGTTETYDGTGTAVDETQWWTAYDQTIAHQDGRCAGMRLFGAYEDTKFGNCSFQTSDFFEKEPLKILASMVDYTGDPCTFEGICVYNECLGKQGMGFGEQVVRDLILSERYLQNFFHTDQRIREITQGSDVLNSVDRNAFYTRYYILHSVPRYSNPSAMMDSDRYSLEIVVTETDPLNPTGNTALESFFSAWLEDCPGCVSMETESCTRCEITPDPIPLIVP